MESNGWRGQSTCWQCGGVWWTWGPMDGVVSARAGSVVVCGGHGVMVTNNMANDHTVSISYQDKNYHEKVNVLSAKYNCLKRTIVIKINEKVNILSAKYNCLITYYCRNKI